MYKSIEDLVTAARSEGPIKIAVAAGHDPDVIEALKEAQAMGLAEGIFVGNSNRIQFLAWRFLLNYEHCLLDLGLHKTSSMAVLTRHRRKIISSAAYTIGKMLYVWYLPIRKPGKWAGILLLNMSPVAYYFPSTGENKNEDFRK